MMVERRIRRLCKGKKGQGEGGEGDKEVREEGQGG